MKQNQQLNGKHHNFHFIIKETINKFLKVFRIKFYRIHEKYDISWTIFTSSFVLIHWYKRQLTRKYTKRYKKRSKYFFFMQSVRIFLFLSDGS